MMDMDKVDSEGWNVRKTKNIFVRNVDDPTFLFVDIQQLLLFVLVLLSCQYPVTINKYVLDIKCIFWLLSF